VSRLATRKPPIRNITEPCELYHTKGEKTAREAIVSWERSLASGRYSEAGNMMADRLLCWNARHTLVTIFLTLGLRPARFAEISAPNPARQLAVGLLMTTTSASCRDLLTHSPDRICVLR
jgi:hypothetical protein